jgi:regulator of cell morphogenesis and NO signaling
MYGPDWLGKLMQTLTTKTIREIALASPETTRVFEALKIDYCCGGRKLFKDACIDLGLDPVDVAGKVEAAMNSRESENQPELQEPSDLIDHIVDKHHSFTVQELARLMPLMEKVCVRHGGQHPELFRLQIVFGELGESLVPHMRKEEIVLFPFIKLLEANEEGRNTRPSAAPFGTVSNPIRMMMDDHDVDGERLRTMRTITNDYDLPSGACPSFKALYSGLQDLERDLHRHIHLENNVLFPAAVKLELAANDRMKG